MFHLNSVPTLAGVTAPFIATTNGTQWLSKCPRSAGYRQTDPCSVRSLVSSKSYEQAEPLLLCQNVNLGPRYHFCTAPPPQPLPQPRLAHKIHFYFGSMYWMAGPSGLSVFVNVGISWNSFPYVIVSLLNNNNRSSSNNNSNNASMERERITGWSFFYTVR